MSARVEAAAKAAHEYENTHCPSFTWESTAEGWRKADRERQAAALAAADAVMFSEAAIERAAKVMFPSYWDPDFYHAHSEATGNVIEESQRQCIDHIRAVVAALREEA